ncbi:hypothetical protein D3C85_1406570 [compost metagenome]
MGGAPVSVSTGGPKSSVAALPSWLATLDKKVNVPEGESTRLIQFFASFLFCSVPAELAVDIITSVRAARLNSAGRLPAASSAACQYPSRLPSLMIDNTEFKVQASAGRPFLSKTLV